MILTERAIVSNRTAELAQVARFTALLAAWLATCGSLFMSEVLGWTPCLLCWYQRILMYPLAIILAVGLLRRDRGLPWYVLPLSLSGAGVSTYHYLLQKTDWVPPPACSLTVPCNVDYINWFGFVTVPFLALTAFLVVSLAMLAGLLIKHEEDLPASGVEYDHVAVVAVIGIVVVGFVVATRLV